MCISLTLNFFSPVPRTAPQKALCAHEDKPGHSQLRVGRVCMYIIISQFYFRVFWDCRADAVHSTFDWVMVEKSCVLCSVSWEHWRVVELLVVEWWQHNNRMDRIGITFFVLCFAVGVPSSSGQNYGKNERLCKLRLALTWLSPVLQFVFTSKTGLIQVWRIFLVRRSFAQPMGSVLRKIDK